LRYLSRPAKISIALIADQQLRRVADENGHSELYPLNSLKQDDYYFSKRISSDNSNSEQAR